MKSLLTALFLGFIFTAAHGQAPLFELLGPLEAVAGEDLMIFCFSPNGGANELTLREDGVAVPLTGDRFSQGEANSTHQLFTLANTIISDDGRMFTCDSSEEPSEPVAVTIFYLTSFTFGVAENFDGTTLLVQEDTDASLPFIIEASPTPLPVLSRDTGGELNMARMMVVDGAVQFTGVNREDSGDYTLTFTNQAGEIPLTFTLTVQFGPSINLVPTNANCVSVASGQFCEVELDTDVTLDCQFTSVPAGTLDIDIPENSTNVRIEGSRIIIENVTEENFADMYQCTASNMVLGEPMSATLTIQIGLEAPTMPPTTEMATTEGEVDATTDGAGKLSPICFVNIFTLFLITLLCHNIKF